MNENTEAEIDEERLGRIVLAPLVSEIGERAVDPVSEYTTGLSLLDERLDGGIDTRATTVVVARTGAGKTGFAIGVGLHIIGAHGLPFLYCSSELEENECFARVGAHRLNVAHGAVYKGRVPRDEATAAVRGVPLHILDKRAMRSRSPAAKVCDHVKRLSDHYGKVPVVAVDFLQNLVPDRTESSIRIGVTSMASDFLDAAADLDAAMMLVSSTGRAFYKPPKEGADDPLTYLSAAKESGDVEYSASNLLFLDVVPEHVAGIYRARIVVAKARRGTIGFVGSAFDGPSGRWWQVDENAGALRADRRKADAKTQIFAEHDAAVMRKLQQAPEMPWRLMRTSCGISKEAADLARDRLVGTGVVLALDERIADSRGRLQPRVVWRLASAVTK